MNRKFTMSLSLNVLNHLGINLYSNIPAVLSEIVANSWDADASEVQINVDDDKITIEDNGCGMSADDINKKFLYVGHRKREASLSSPIYKRPYMGRKGIGKLSMFSISQEIDVYSRKKIDDNNFEFNAFRMDSAKIESSIKGETDSNQSTAYYPEVLELDENILDHAGTKIVLKKLKKNTSSLTAEYIKKRVARRFGIIGGENHFKVYVNGQEVTISDRDYFHKVRYIWYYGKESERFPTFCDKLTYSECRDNFVIVNNKKYTISGWIGSVDASGDLKDEDDNLNKIVILVRGKLGQEDILSEYSEGGLYSKYLIGEINADFFDDDNFEDMATSNRQEYRHDDDRFIALRNFIYNELKYIQGKWTELRNNYGENKARELLPVIDTWLGQLKGDDKEYAKKMFGKINQIIADDNKKREILKYSILAFEKLRYTQHLSAIDKINPANFEVFKDICVGMDDIEATLYYQIIKERIQIIKKFREITENNQSLEKVIQQYLFDHLWLLDPSWERANNTEYMEKTVLNALNAQVNTLTEDEKRGRLDLGYRQTAGKHVIIELKKADRVVKSEEAYAQLRKYHNALKKVLSSIYSTDYAFEILFIVGKPIDNSTDISEQQTFSESIAAFHARVITYQQLIENALKAYSEYLEENRTSQPLVDMFTQLENDPISDC